MKYGISSGEKIQLWHLGAKGSTSKTLFSIKVWTQDCSLLEPKEDKAQVEKGVGDGRCQMSEALGWRRECWNRAEELAGMLVGEKGG